MSDQLCQGVHALVGDDLQRLTFLANVLGHQPFVFLDHPENGLHPSAVRALIARLREANEADGGTAILITDSPVLLDCFKDCPWYVLVADRALGVRPLDEVLDEDYLAHFSLGDLYDRGEFGALPRDGTQETNVSDPKEVP